MIRINTLLQYDRLKFRSQYLMVREEPRRIHPRAWHAVPKTLVDPDGNPVNALHGFARFIGDALKQLQPQRLAAPFAPPENLFERLSRASG
jgi:hypothetical protein